MACQTGNVAYYLLSSIRDQALDRMLTHFIQRP